ncbi:hypothetical protein JCM19233_392 [Vibrio astriarenae]|nr:hypothetical protein JCM19233_392 [Vibrio sp. C7]
MFLLGRLENANVGPTVQVKSIEVHYYLNIVPSTQLRKLLVLRDKGTALAHRVLIQGELEFDSLPESLL